MAEKQEFLFEIIDVNKYSLNNIIKHIYLILKKKNLLDFRFKEKGYKDQKRSMYLKNLLNTYMNILQE